MESIENSESRFDGVYNKLICQEDFSADEHPLDSNPHQQQVSMSMVRAGPTLRHYRLAAVSLALLAALLLAVDIGLGVYYSKLTGGHLPYGITHISNELTKLQDTYKTAIQTVDEAKKQLAREISQQELTKWELEHQKRRSNDYKGQIDQIQQRNAALQSHIPMSKEGCRHCLPGWIFLNSVCYYIPLSDTITPKGWHEAREKCKRDGADLAVIDSSEKQLSISQVINGQGFSGPIGHNGFWIGLRDEQEEGTWKWLDGTTLIEGYWNDGEPNDQYNEDCAAVYHRINPFKAWNDAPCRHPLKWICEMAANSELTL
ncbi:uncharacterized protein LOC139930848 [Centroberyx gerrardi]